MKRINNDISRLLLGQPRAAAVLSGSRAYPDLHGIVRFYQMKSGVLVYADIDGLPHEGSRCSQDIFGFHIHVGGSCTGNADDPFADAGTHLNEEQCRHPMHTGDLPPLFGNSGRAVSIFLTNRFSIDEIIGKAVIIHGSPDDLTTQPSGNAGTKIACGIVTPVCRTSRTNIC